MVAEWRTCVVPTLFLSLLLLLLLLTAVIAAVLPPHVWGTRGGLLRLPPSPTRCCCGQPPAHLQALQHDGPRRHVHIPPHAPRPDQLQRDFLHIHRHRHTSGPGLMGSSVTSCGSPLSGHTATICDCSRMYEPASWPSSLMPRHRRCLSNHERCVPSPANRIETGLRRGWQAQGTAVACAFTPGYCCAGDGGGLCARTRGAATVQLHQGGRGTCLHLQHGVVDGPLVGGEGAACGEGARDVRRVAPAASQSVSQAVSQPIGQAVSQPMLVVQHLQGRVSANWLAGWLTGWLAG
jgi:hypothetical protein